MTVLYEDNHLIAVSKRVGDIVQGDKTGDVPLSDLVKTYIKDKYQKPGNVYLAFCQDKQGFASTQQDVCRASGSQENVSGDSRQQASAARRDAYTLVDTQRKAEHSQSL